MSDPGLLGPLVAVHSEVVQRGHLTLITSRAESGGATTIPSASPRNGAWPSVLRRFAAVLVDAYEGVAPAMAFDAKGKAS